MDRELGADGCPAASRTRDRQPTADGSDAIVESSKARACRRVGATATVVADFDQERVASLADRHPRAAGAGITHHVRQRLGHDEVCGRFDGGMETAVDDVGNHRNRRPFRERIDRRGEPRFREDRRVDATGESADLSDRGLQLGRGRVEQSGRFRRRLLRDLEPHRERDEALLGTIMEVALDAPSLRIGRLHDAHPRGTHLLELGTHLGGQPLVLEREPGRVADRFDEARILDLDQRVVDEDAEQLIAVLEARHRAGRVTDRQVDGMAGGIDVARARRRSEGDLQARVAQGAGEDVAEAAERHTPAELHDEARHASPIEARTEERDEEAERQDHRDDQPQGGPGWAVEERCPGWNPTAPTSALAATTANSMGMATTTGNRARRRPGSRPASAATARRGSMAPRHDPTTIEPLVMSSWISAFGQTAKTLRTQSGTQATVTSQNGCASSACPSRSA